MTATTTPQPAGRPLTLSQQIILGVGATAMIGIGVLGAYGTYSNLTTTFPGSTALGAVAAGEGATMILALVYVGLTMLGQTSPAAVRLGLWALPTVASSVGAVAAHSATATVIFAVTPLAMCTAAEGAGLLARRIVVRTTGIDVEARRRTADAVRKLAYERARAEHHPDKDVRKRAERRAWRLARRVGAGDTDLGEQLVDVQRARLTEGADAALAVMFAPSVTPDRDAVPTAVTDVPTAAVPETPPAPAIEAQQPEAVTAVPEPVTQVTALAVTLDQLAAVAGVPVPTTGVPLTADQLTVVLRYLRYQDDPPLSYRQAVTAFRDAGYVGSEERVRRAWGELMSREEDAATD